MIDKKILDLQQPSTRACLERPVEKDDEWLSRIIPKEAQVVKEDGSVDLNVRIMTAGEVAMEEGVRRKRGSWIAGIRGESDMLSVSEHRKLTAIDAFLNKFSFERIKDKFKALMGDVAKPKSYVEVMAEHINRIKNEK